MGCLLSDRSLWACALTTLWLCLLQAIAPVLYIINGQVTGSGKSVRVRHPQSAPPVFARVASESYLLRNTRLTPTPPLAATRRRPSALLSSPASSPPSPRATPAPSCSTSTPRRPAGAPSRCTLSSTTWGRGSARSWRRRSSRASGRGPRRSTSPCASGPSAGSSSSVRYKGRRSSVPHVARARYAPQSACAVGERLFETRVAGGLYPDGAMAAPHVSPMLRSALVHPRERREAAPKQSGEDHGGEGAPPPRRAARGAAAGGGCHEGRR